VREAARFLCLPESTLKAWVRGQKYPTQSQGQKRAPPVIVTEDSLLSFWNLAEAYVLAGIRRHHGVAFGRPVIAGTAVPVEPLLERFRAGDSLKEIAVDYRLDPETLEGVIRWESAASAAAA
jgi:uncharacterized protein (DUF433 family)